MRKELFERGKFRTTSHGSKLRVRPHINFPSLASGRGPKKIFHAPQKDSRTEIALRAIGAIFLSLMSTLSSAGLVSASAQDRSHFEQRDGIDSPAKPPDGVTGNLELVPLFKATPSMPSVTFELPDSARFGATRAFTRANGVNLMVAYYKSDGTIKGIGAEATGRCKTADCRPIMLTIENIDRRGVDQTNADRIHAASMNRIDISRSQSNVHIEEVDPLGFTLGFETRIASKSSNFAIVDREYFRKEVGYDHYDLAARCSMWTPVHVCQLYFSLPCAPQIAVSTSSYPSFEELGDADRVRAASVSFIASLVTSEKLCRN